MATVGLWKAPSRNSLGFISERSELRATPSRSLSFASSNLSGDKLISSVFFQRRCSVAHSDGRVPFIVSPKAVSDSRNSQTCLDPEASRSVLGIILGGGAGTRLYPLTKKRAKPAVPLGANYRLIDIPVSNCLNSNISKIYVLTQFNSASLNRHLSRAYASNMGGYKNEGFVEVLAAQQSPENPNWFQVQAYLYDGYWEDIGTIEAFYNANLGITKKPVPDFSFYDRSSPIYTQPRYLPPSKMLNADVTDSVIGEGCVIKSCKIHHSVVGLRSCISEGAIIEDTLLMGADYYETDADRRFLAAKGSVPVGIGKNSHIKRAIIDKNARIGENVKIINSDNVQEAARETDGYFIKSGIVTVIKDALIPSGTVI
ncbi:unnamed protein product [Ilex paraguariensis]|uniref:glucose-1-phosphate adenylyltransferase n=1 Tax=Ilex paraguariensis TaxID=185542 RepID=A0ABC8SZF8_9AQUA